MSISFPVFDAARFNFIRLNYIFLLTWNHYPKHNLENHGQTTSNPLRPYKNHPK